MLDLSLLALEEEDEEDEEEEEEEEEDEEEQERKECFQAETNSLTTCNPLTTLTTSLAAMEFCETREKSQRGCPLTSDHIPLEFLFPSPDGSPEPLPVSCEVGLHAGEHSAPCRADSAL